MTSTPTTAGSTVTTAYNYSRFQPSFYDLASFDGPKIGEFLPDLTLTDVDGEPRELSEFAGRTVVVETGSVTCPMYAKGIPAMNRLAHDHPDVAFVTLYVREAHPGERIGAHRTDTDKRQRAGTVRRVLGDERLILVDDVDGTAHRRLGLLPNMVYVVGPDGRVVFRGDWTDSAAVEAVLTGTADRAERVREHYPPAKPSPRTAVTTLLNGGWRALFDFAVGLPALMAQHRRADRAHRAAPSPTSPS